MGRYADGVLAFDLEARCYQCGRDRFEADFERLIASDSEELDSVLRARNPCEHCGEDRVRVRLRFDEARPDRPHSG